MWELSAWDTLIYTLLVLVLMFLLSKVVKKKALSPYFRDGLKNIVMDDIDFRLWILIKNI